MARNGNTFYASAASSSNTDTYVAVKGARVHDIVFMPNDAGDAVTISDMASNGSIGAGATKVVLRAAVAKDTQHFRFTEAPMVFPNGIWISSMDADCHLTLILTDERS